MFKYLFGLKRSWFTRNSSFQCSLFKQ